MTLVPHLAAIVLAAPLAAAAVSAAEDPAARDLLAPHRGIHRVLLALAPAPSDPGLAAQRSLFAAMGQQARERDLVQVEATDATPAGAALRRRFGGSGFRAVLIGKDGGDKLTATTPLDAATLFPLIDAMPMRQDEMRRKR